MSQYLALLRAVNVGGHARIGMAPLCALFAELQLTQPRSLLQTGNVVFSCRSTGTATLERRLEAAVADRFGVQTAILVRSAVQWQQSIAANPFAAEARDDPAHLVLMPLCEAPKAAAIAALQAAIPGHERMMCRGRDLYLYYPDGIGRSKLTSALIEKRLATQGTGRNWNTTLKLASLLGQED
ncbi:MAG: DUF1697 domain-containing protein [Steroidobacteraceae bacterium]